MSGKMENTQIAELSHLEIEQVDGGARLVAARLVYMYVRNGAEIVYNAAKEAGRAMTRTTD